MDVATASSVTLTNSEITKIPTELIGPLWEKSRQLGGLLVGRSSATLRGITVIPGVSDPDFRGQIYILAYTICPPLLIPTGAVIAQLLAFPNFQPNQGTDQKRVGGFGSTNPMVCFTQSLKQRPMILVELTWGDHSLKVFALLDTGSDVTIVSRRVWPEDWGLSPVTGVVGIGGSSAAMKGQVTPRISFQDVTVHMRVYVMDLPGNLQMLVGRDLLGQSGAVLTTGKPQLFQ